MNAFKPIRTRFLHAVVALAALAGASAMLAQSVASAAPHGPMAGGPLMEAIEQLDLSDAQRKELRAIFKSHRDQAKAEREQAAEGRKAFAALDPDSPRYAAQVEELANEAAQKIRVRIPGLAEVHAEVRAVLTEAQRQQAIERIRSVDLQKLSEARSGHLLAMFEDLDLSDEQWLALRGIRARREAGAGGDREQMQERIARFLSLDPAAADYQAKLAALSEEFAEAAKRHVHAFAQVQKEVYAVLTPSQRSELIAKMETFDPRDHFRKMRGARS